MHFENLEKIVWGRRRPELYGEAVIARNPVHRVDCHQGIVVVAVMVSKVESKLDQ